MRKEIFSYLKIAARIAKRGENSRSFFLGCVGIRASDGTLIYSNNGKTDAPQRTSHAEYRASRKLTPGSTLYVARILRSSEFAMARPCWNCMKALKDRGIKNVYYTISNAEFGRIYVPEVDLSEYRYRV